MKKIYIAAMTVLAAVALSSCVQEKSFKDVTLDKDAVGFTINRVSTRSSETDLPERNGVIIPCGNSLCIEETIIELNPSSPATRGTPAYTENLGVLYDFMGVHAEGGNFGDSVFEKLDDDMYDRKGESTQGWRYSHYFGSVDPWPTNGSAVGFYLRMPATPAGVTFGTSPYSEGTVSFSYESPATAKEQQDILFGYTSLTKAQHDSYRPNGAPVNMVHALTGVKFAIDNYSAPEDENITIKSVVFKGLRDTGTCEINASGEVSWTPGDISGETYSSGDYGEPIKFEGGSFENNGDYPESFSAAGNENNLNDGDATQTFWLIPQAMNDDILLEITYIYGKDVAGKDIERTETLLFGKILAEKNVVWGAGQLRTYTIRVDEVNVKIEDTVNLVGPVNVDVDDSDTPLKSFQGSTKTAVKIYNTGNTDAYIRAAIIGQWLDEESGDPVFGYTDFTSGQFKFVDSWYQDQFGTDAQHDQGEFSGLIGYDLTSSPYWEKHSDGYYYYKYVVPAESGTIPGAYKTVANGKATDVAAPSPVGNQPLFLSYTVGDAPTAAVAGHVKQIYFQLEIATQAISAKKPDGSYYTMEEAWEKANTPDPVEP